MSKRRKERTLHDHTIDFGGDCLICLLKKSSLEEELPSSNDNDGELLSCCNATLCNIID
jgi:hypothetical protein